MLQVYKLDAYVFKLFNHLGCLLFAAVILVQRIACGCEFKPANFHKVVYQAHLLNVVATVLPDVSPGNRWIQI